MAAPGMDALRRIAQAKQAVAQSLEAACIAYANGANGANGQAAPIVDDRFKGQGNRRFQPLNPDYARWKQGMVRREQRTSAAGPVGSDLVARGRTSGRTGSAKVKGTARGSRGKNLPILVGPNRYRKGVLVHQGSELRQRVSGGKRHRIILNVSGLSATIIFTGLPPYALVHHLGVELPQRSPVKPNAEDMAKFKAVMLRVLRMRLGRARANVGAPTDLAKNSTPRRAPP